MKIHVAGSSIALCAKLLAGERGEQRGREGGERARGRRRGEDMNK